VTPSEPDGEQHEAEPDDDGNDNPEPLAATSPPATTQIEQMDPELGTGNEKLLCVIPNMGGAGMTVVFAFYMCL